MNAVGRRAFVDELTKIAANYSLSRLLTHPATQAIKGGLSGTVSKALEVGALAGFHPLAVGGGAALGALQGVVGGMGGALADRRNYTHATLARILRGGRGLMNSEKHRLAESIGVSPHRLETLIANVAGKKNPTDYMTPAESIYSRLSTSSLFPHKAIGRIIDARALAGRIERGEPLLQHEQQLINTLRRENRIQKVKDVLPLLGVGTAAAAAGAAATHAIHRSDR